MRRDKTTSRVARRVVLEAEEPFAYAIAGDLYQGARELVLGTGPRVRLVLP